MPVVDVASLVGDIVWFKSPSFPWVSSAFSSVLWWRLRRLDFLNAGVFEGLPIIEHRCLTHASRLHMQYPAIVMHLSKVNKEAKGAFERSKIADKISLMFFPFEKGSPQAFYSVASASKVKSFDAPEAQSYIAEGLALPGEDKVQFGAALKQAEEEFKLEKSARTYAFEESKAAAPKGAKGKQLKQSAAETSSSGADAAAPATSEEIPTPAPAKTSAKKKAPAKAAGSAVAAPIASDEPAVAGAAPSAAPDSAADEPAADAEAAPPQPKKATKLKLKTSKPAAVDGHSAADQQAGAAAAANDAAAPSSTSPAVAGTDHDEAATGAAAGSSAAAKLSEKAKKEAEHQAQLYRKALGLDSEDTGAVGFVNPALLAPPKPSASSRAIAAAAHAHVTAVQPSAGPAPGSMAAIAAGLAPVEGPEEEDARRKRSSTKSRKRAASVSSDESEESDMSERSDTESDFSDGPVSKRGKSKKVGKSKGNKGSSSSKNVADKRRQKAKAAPAAAASAHKRPRAVEDSDDDEAGAAAAGDAAGAAASAAGASSAGAEQDQAGEKRKREAHKPVGVNQKYIVGGKKSKPEKRAERPPREPSSSSAAAAVAEEEDEEDAQDVPAELPPPPHPQPAPEHTAAATKLAQQIVEATKARNNAALMPLIFKSLHIPVSPDMLKASKLAEALSALKSYASLPANAAGADGGAAAAAADDDVSAEEVQSSAVASIGRMRTVCKAMLDWQAANAEITKRREEIEARAQERAEFAEKRKAEAARVVDEKKKAEDEKIRIRSAREKAELEEASKKVPADGGIELETAAEPDADDVARSAAAPAASGVDADGDQAMDGGGGTAPMSTATETVKPVAPASSTPAAKPAAPAPPKPTAAVASASSLLKSIKPASTAAAPSAASLAPAAGATAALLHKAIVGAGASAGAAAATAASAAAAAELSRPRPADRLRDTAVCLLQECLLQASTGASSTSSVLQSPVAAQQSAGGFSAGSEASMARVCEKLALAVESRLHEGQAATTASFTLPALQGLTSALYPGDAGNSKKEEVYMRLVRGLILLLDSVAESRPDHAKVRGDRTVDPTKRFVAALQHASKNASMELARASKIATHAPAPADSGHGLLPFEAQVVIDSLPLLNLMLS